MDDPRTDPMAATIHSLGGDGRARQREAPAAVRESGGVAALLDPALDPLFRPAARQGVGSAWWQHVPFAHWVMRATSPRVFVELGSHNGVSYSAFCEAVVNECLPTRCHAVDTWRGDKHSGEYGEEVYHDLCRFHDARYASFSTLMRLTFDEACGWFGDRTIDLLHIDGLHTYEAVRHDFETWQPKLSDRGVVLFHDINVRHQDFGVWRFWEEMRDAFPSFEFHHCYGLGVLAVGDDAPKAILDLCALDDPAEIARLRARFRLVGEHWGLSETIAHLGNAHADADRLRGEKERAEAEIASLRGTITRLEKAAAERVAALRSEPPRLAARPQEPVTHNTELDRALAEIDRLAAEVRRLHRAWPNRVALRLRALGRKTG